MANRALNANERDLIRALGNEDVEEVRRLVEDKGVDVNTQDSLRRTSIIRACFASEQEKRTAMGKLLLDNGADVNLAERHGRTALIVACMEVDKEDIVEIILSAKKVDPNRQDEDGNTALMNAVMLDNVAAVRVLLSPENKSKINTDLQNFQDKTPLFVAAKQQNTEICELLMQEGGASSDNIPNFYKKYLPDTIQKNKEESKENMDKLYKNYRDNALEPNVVQRSTMNPKGKPKKKPPKGTKRKDDNTPRGGPEPQPEIRNSAHEPNKAPKTEKEKSEIQEKENIPSNIQPSSEKQDDHNNRQSESQSVANRESPNADDQPDTQSQNQSPTNKDTKDDKAKSAERSNSRQIEERQEKTAEGQLFFKVDVEQREHRATRRRSGGEELADDSKINSNEHTGISSMSSVRSTSSAKDSNRPTQSLTPSVQSHVESPVAASANTTKTSSSKSRTTKMRNETTSDQRLKTSENSEEKRKAHTNLVREEIVEPVVVASTHTEVQQRHKSSKAEENNKEHKTLINEKAIEPAVVTSTYTEFQQAKASKQHEEERTPAYGKEKFQSTIDNVVKEEMKREQTLSEMNNDFQSTNNEVAKEKVVKKWKEKKKGKPEIKQAENCVPPEEIKTEKEVIAKAYGKEKFQSTVDNVVKEEINKEHTVSERNNDFQSTNKEVVKEKVVKKWKEKRKGTPETKQAEKCVLPEETKIEKEVIAKSEVSSKQERQMSSKEDAEKRKPSPKSTRNREVKEEIQKEIIETGNKRNTEPINRKESVSTKYSTAVGSEIKQEEDVESSNKMIQESTATEDTKGVADRQKKTLSPVADLMVASSETVAVADTLMPTTAKSTLSLQSNMSSKRKSNPTSTAESSRPPTVKSTRSMQSTISVASTTSSKRGAWIRPPPDLTRLHEEADEHASKKGKKTKKVKLKKEDQPVYETRSGRIIRPNICDDAQYRKIQAAKLKIVVEEEPTYNKGESGGALSGPSFEKVPRKKKKKPKQKSD